MFDEICNKIISPPKFRYSLYDLGASLTKWGKRTDFQIVNHKKQKMHCSLFEPHTIKFDRACVVYLHSMNGSRLEGSVYVERILKEGTSFCTFDFSGCGNSDGDKLSFGANQKYDIQALINKLKEGFYLNRFILWGRSMGASTAIKYSELVHDKAKALVSVQAEQIIGLVLDSSFKSFSQLLVEIGHSQSQIPKFLIHAGFFIIRSTLEKNGEFRISDLDLIGDQNQNVESVKYPLRKLQNLKLPILFLASKEDKTVSYQHSVDMFNAYKCKYKQLKYFKGLHNESRQEDYVLEVVSFIRKLLNKEIKRDVQTESNNDTPTGQTLGKYKNKSSLVQLIQQNSQQQPNSTLFEFESLQNTCVCTIFDNQLAKKTQNKNNEISNRTSPFKQIKSSENKRTDSAMPEPFGPRITQHNFKLKKSISDLSVKSHSKFVELNLNNPSKPPILSPNLKEAMQSPTSYMRVSQNVGLTRSKGDNRLQSNCEKGSKNILSQLYSPLRVGSERSLKIGISEVVKGV